MSGTDNTITDVRTNVPPALVGKAVEGLEAVIVARDDMAWGTVRIHAGDATFDVTNTLRDLPINDVGDDEEFAVLSVSEAGTGELHVEDVDKASGWCELNATITDVALVNGHVTATEADSVIMERAYTQAVVLELDDGDYLVLDKGPWFSEMITIGMGSSWEELVYDDSQDWEDDPEEPAVHYSWERLLARA